MTSLPQATSDDDLEERQAVVEHNRYRVKTLRQMGEEARVLEGVKAEEAKRRQAQAPGRPQGTKKSLSPEVDGETSSLLIDNTLPADTSP